MSTVIKSPNPKLRFQESADNVSKHRDLIASREFQRAADFALLQYEVILSNTPLDNFNMAASAHFRLLGAQEFLQVLRTLGETQSAPAKTLIEELNYKV